MKNALYAATGLLAAGLAGPALLSTPVQAQEQPIKLSLGGKLRHFFFVSDQDQLPTERLNATGMSTDAEVYFRGTTTLDSGLQVTAVMEMEAESRNDRNGDEVYIDFRDTWGRLRIGEKESFNASFIGEPAPEAFLTTDERVIGEMAIPRRNGITVNDMFTFKRFSNDVLGVQYQTPEMNGFTGAVAYFPSTTDVEGTIDRATQRNNAVDVSGQWRKELNDSTRLKFGGGYIHIDSRATPTGNDGLESWNANVSTTFGRITAGGTFIAVNPDNGADERAWTVGALTRGYPWTFSADYTSALREATPGAAIKEKTEIIKLQAAYKVGPGIDVGVTGFYTDQRTSTGTKFDGTGAVVGAKLDF